ncbi:MAG TPA: hypothetical protein VKQ32_18540 [Polyangia bacterium]|nr:hypothetical protein [Polyangia bacterium]
MNSKAALVISYVFLALGVLSLAGLVVEIGYGGSASSGKIENGHFFLRRKSPREDLRYVQVSEPVFRYLAWHEKTFELGMVIAVAASANIQRIRKRRGAA